MSKPEMAGPNVHIQFSGADHRLQFTVILCLLFSYIFQFTGTEFNLFYFSNLNYNLFGIRQGTNLAMRCVQMDPCRQAGRPPLTLMGPALV